MAEICTAPLTVHVGYHKTATTFLQRSLFARADTFSAPWSIEDLDRLLARPAPFTFDALTARAELEFCAAVGDGPVVVSHEDLVGHPFSGGFAGPEIADRLAAVFPEMRVLVVVREQASMLVSIYKQYVRGGGARQLEQLVEPLPNDRRVPAFTLEHYRYDRLVDHYQRALGPERVRVLPFELLRAEPDRFVAEVCEFVGAAPPADLGSSPVNVGVTAGGVRLKRLLNRWFVRDAINPTPIIAIAGAPRATTALVRRLERAVPGPLRRRGEARLARRAEVIVGDRFASSNTELARLTGLELAPLGYVVE